MTIDDQSAPSQQAESSVTIVTAIDGNYLWGAYLLICSVRAAGMKVPVNVYGFKLSPEQSQLLTQFPNVKVIPHDTSIQLHRFTCIKPHALYTADSDFVAWLDADCMVTGDITPFLISSENVWLVRHRDKEEQYTLSRSLYHSNDLIPEWILESWSTEIGERKLSRYQTTFSTCALSLHQSQMGFVKRWEKLMAQVIQKQNPLKNRRFFGRSEIIDRKLGAFTQTDESVINALFCFSDQAPPVEQMRADQDPNAMILHFVESPKPWEGWIPRNWQHYDFVLNLVDWAKEQGYQRPPLPRALNRRFRWVSWGRGAAYFLVRQLKQKLGVLVKKFKH